MGFRSPYHIRPPLATHVRDVHLVVVLPADHDDSGDRVHFGVCWPGFHVGQRVGPPHALQAFDLMPNQEVCLGVEDVDHTCLRDLLRNVDQGLVLLQVQSNELRFSAGGWVVRQEGLEGEDARVGDRLDLSEAAGACPSVQAEVHERLLLAGLGLHLHRARLHHRGH